MPLPSYLCYSRYICLPTPTPKNLLWEWFAFWSRSILMHLAPDTHRVVRDSSLLICFHIITLSCYLKREELGFCFDVSVQKDARVSLRHNLSGSSRGSQILHTTTSRENSGEDKHKTQISTWVNFILETTFLYCSGWSELNLVVIGGLSLIK